MRGRMSLAGAIARGLVVFTAMTASLALALFIAITGPPSNDEMAGLRVVADAALTKFEEGTRALGVAVCAQLPPKLKAAAECAEEAVEQAKAEPPPAVPLPPDTTVPQPPVQIAQTPDNDTLLLGANPAAPATSVPVVMAPVHITASTPHARAHATRTTSRATHRPTRRTRAAQTNRATTHSHTPPHRAPARTHTPPAPTPVVTHPTPAPEQPAAHTTPVVAPAQTPPPLSQPAVAVPHPQLAAPEPRVAAAPPSAAPPDTTQEDAPAADPPLEKQDPDQAQTF